MLLFRFQTLSHFISFETQDLFRLLKILDLELQIENLFLLLVQLFCDIFFVSFQWLCFILLLYVFLSQLWYFFFQIIILSLQGFSLLQELLLRSLQSVVTAFYFRNILNQLPDPPLMLSLEFLNLRLMLVLLLTQFLLVNHLKIIWGFLRLIVIFLIFLKLKLRLLQ